MSSVLPVHINAQTNSTTEIFLEIQKLLPKNSGQKILDCFTALLGYAQERQYYDPLALLQKNERGGGLRTLAALVPCDMVTQWGERFPFLLLFPLLGQELEPLAEAACQYAQQQKTLGLLTFCHKPQRFGSLTAKFSAAWQYTITASFPIAESALWLLPLQEEELRYNGGEIDLPRELAPLWDVQD